MTYREMMTTGTKVHTQSFGHIVCVFYHHPEHPDAGYMVRINDPTGVSMFFEDTKRKAWDEATRIATALQNQGIESGLYNTEGKPCRWQRTQRGIKNYPFDFRSWAEVEAENVKKRAKRLRQVPEDQQQEEMWSEAMARHDESLDS